jgi:hypothetical protein
MNTIQELQGENCGRQLQEMTGALVEQRQT